MKEFFKRYHSNTTAGSSNQTFFESDGKEHTARVYYRIFEGGSDRFSLLFSNTTDSTFADGGYSVCNMQSSFEILSVRVGLTDTAAMDEATEPSAFQSLTFDGCAGSLIDAAEIATDPFALAARTGEYLCVETVFRGGRVPCHREIKIPTFLQKDGKWIPTPDVPVPMMLGCDRPVTASVGFLGDSITQGIGATPNAYRHYVAVAAERLPRDCAFWNLGIGYARATDAASDGAWLYKVKQNDLVTVCLGVNDILQGRTAEEIKAAHRTILECLLSAGVRVVLQSVPPFDYSPEKTEIWNEVNEYMERELAPQAYGYFDTRKILSDPAVPQRAIFGGHPNDEGCRLWGEGLAAYLKALIEGEAK